MTCSDCGGHTKVMDTVTIANEVYRRRRCLNCNKLFFTEEIDVGYKCDVRYKFNQAKMKYFDKTERKEVVNDV